MKRILVVAAHPDDEVLGCGGTISRLSDEGHDVYIAILGEGITSRYPERHLATPSTTEELRNSCKKAADNLGVKDLFIHQLPDNRFDSVPLLDVVKIIEEMVERIEPMSIYTHHGGDLNIDHVITHRAIMTAVRPVKDCPVKDVYAFEVASATEWAFQQFQPIFKPTVFRNISMSIHRKIEALAYYESEVRIFPHPRSPDAIKANARRWGAAVGFDYAEAFELIRTVR